ncbi:MULTISPECIES: SPRY domain-containing protein [unclassified Pseudodesulfovibrio]|uniref:SPRY domain-containing protein n=1 Tax=unclassified Pseudodesulfovibrio TaxID=2661612 RepID=UPI000FEB8B77|nr:MULTISPECIES: SPRY domain-containing protein [unclassified Pseudodesulfovibrio]MCJ2165536.1 SPRY domain-containing protein [Pseudodesulfovibrio sp. S3-i]RWU03103.1 hypothetical protein DWB63_12925 [Pseudodesulfovibrio sp. S3]
MLTPKETGGTGGGGVYPLDIPYSALCESGYSSTGAVANDCTIALGFKPTAVDSTKTLCDPTHHYLLTIKKTGDTVEVWKQGTQLANYTGSVGSNYAGFIGALLLAYAGTHHGYYSRLVIAESGLTHTDFWQQSSTVPGLWVPKSISGLTLHMLLDFSNAADLGNDTSGNGNHWTLTSATQSTDTPTNNCCTINPLSYSGGGYANGNLSWWVPANNRGCQGWYGMTTGKHYFECQHTNGSCMIGVTPWPSDTNHVAYRQHGIGWYSYPGDSRIMHSNANTINPYGSPYSPGDIVQVAVDMEVGAVWFGVNGTWHYGATEAEILAGDTTHAAATWTPDGRTYFPGAGMYGGSTVAFAFAESDLTHTPPTGFLTLEDRNRAEPTLLNPEEYFTVASFVAPSAASQNITAGWDAENEDWLLILKSVSGGASIWIDTMRGLNKALYCPGTAVESTLAAPLTVSGSTITLPDNLLTDGQAYMAYIFRKSATAGFDMVQYTGNATAGHTIPHGLGAVPKFVVTRARNNGQSWITQDAYTGPTKFMYLDGGAVAATNAAPWNNVAATSTNVTLGNAAYTNGNTVNFIMYLFADAELYKFIEYQGNANANGAYFDTDGTPLATMFHRNTAINSRWFMHNRERSPVNPVQEWWSTQEIAVYTTALFDLLSTGEKMISTDTFSNGNGQGHIAIVARTQNKYRNAI